MLLPDFLIIDLPAKINKDKKFCKEFLCRLKDVKNILAKVKKNTKFIHLRKCNVFIFQDLVF